MVINHRLMNIHEHNCHGTIQVTPCIIRPSIAPLVHESLALLITEKGRHLIVVTQVQKHNTYRISNRFNISSGGKRCFR